MKNRLILCCWLGLILLSGQALGQEGVEQVRPSQEPAFTQQPSMRVAVEPVGFFNPAKAQQAGQWNPTITEIPAPGKARPGISEEVRQKTQQKLEAIRNRPEGWPDEEGPSARMATLMDQGKNWQNLTAGGWIPPDNCGAISSEGYIVSAKNSQIGFYDEDGNAIAEWSLADFFSSSSAADGNIVYDPRVEYSNAHNRWIVVALAGSSPSNTHVLVAFSVGSNPQSGFHFYTLDGDVSFPGTVWFDYPKIAVSDDDLFITGNRFNASNEFEHAAVYQIPLDPAFSGQGFTYTSWSNIPDSNGNLAASLVPLGKETSANDQGIFLVSASASQLHYYWIDDNTLNNPSFNSYSVNGEASFSNGGDVVQQGSTQLLDGGGTRIRDGFMRGNVMHFVHCVDGGDGFWRIRYLQADVTNGQTLVDQTLGSTGYDYCYPSINKWGSNGVVIGFLRSATNIYPELRVVQYDNGWGNSVLIKEGESPIIAYRWGDYIDGAFREGQPSEEVWLFGQYGKDNGHANWVAQLYEPIFGCMDPLACNYNANATDQGAVCNYEAQLDTVPSTYFLTVEPVATHTEGELAGMTTYRVHLNCEHPTDFLSSCSGATCNPLIINSSTGNWYNSPFNSSYNASGISSAFVDLFPDLAFDSYLTIGSSLAEHENHPGYIGEAKAQFMPSSDNLGSNVLVDDVAGEIWYSSWPGSIPTDLSSHLAFAGDDLQILVMQVTTAGTISGQMTVQVFPEGVPSNDKRYQLTFDSNNTGCMDPAACNYNATAQFPAECFYPGCTSLVACNFNPDAGCDDGSCCFDNCGRVLMLDQSADGWNGSALQIFDEAGMLVFETSLEEGSMGEDTFCLGDGCYTVDVTEPEGAGAEDISWLLNMNWDHPLGFSGSDATTILGGGAPENGLIFEVNGAACFEGCTYVEALNYNGAAVVDDGSCLFEVGCNECTGDFDGNLAVNTADLLAFLSVFGNACP